MWRLVLFNSIYTGLWIERIIRDAGGQRVSESAKKALASAIEDYAIEVSKKAVNMASHAGRKTVKEEDIKMAIRKQLFY